MYSRASSPLGTDTRKNSSGSKRDIQGSIVDRSRRAEKEPEGLKQHIRLQESRFEGEAAIGRTNSDGSSSNSGSNRSGGYRSVPHHHNHHHYHHHYDHHHHNHRCRNYPSSSTTTGDARSPSSHSPLVTSFTDTSLPTPVQGNCADAAMSDQRMSDSPALCGGGGGAIIVVPSSTSRRPPWEFLSSVPSLTNSVPSNDDPFLQSSPMGCCCTSESAAEPSHSCDLNCSHQDRLHFLHLHHHQQQQQQQVDLSIGLTSPRAVAPLSAARDAPGLLPSNEDRQCGISARQQGIASSPAAAVADQDPPPFASTIPNSWNNSPSPAPSFGSSSSAHSSNLSSETEFGGGGAPVTPDDFDGTLRNKHLSPFVDFSDKSTGTPNTNEDDDEEDSDGGITVDHSDSEMASSGPVQVLYSSSALHVTAMDGDEDDFSPNNLVTRPPSPVGSDSSFMNIFSSLSREPPEINGGLQSPYMQLDPGQDGQDGLDPISNLADTLRPSVELLGSRSQSPSIPSTPFEIITDSSSPNIQARGTDGLELVAGEDDELFVIESNYTNPTDSMPSQSYSPSPPTAAAAVTPPAPLAAAVVAASEIMAEVAGVGGITPSPTHASLLSPTLPPPRPPLPPPLPPHVSRTPSLFLPFDGPVFDGESISEDELDGLTNREHFSPLEDIENYNFDFSRFCTHAYYRYRMNSKFPKFSAAATDIRNMERPLEVTRMDMQENGWDYQAIPWEKLGTNSEVARGIRRKEYDNYRNIKGVEEENPPIVPANRNLFSFRRMDTTQRCRLIHFQLRNLLGVVSRNDVFYAGDAQVLHTNPLTSKTRTVMDLQTPDSWSGNPIRISTLGACGGSNGVVIAGCFHGEYAMKSIHASADSATITGIVTGNESGITNHVQMIKNRTSGMPNAVFSSNDFFIRVLNCGEGMQFLSEHKYSWPVNCSVTSPDSRLRVVVGDDTDVLICDAQRGTTEFVLKGHRDFGFAAAWSDDGYTIATGNQDKTVRIFDARNLSKTVKVLPAVMAGVRTLRFSPIGNGGKRVLAMAEPGDVVQIVDAVSWDSLQQIDFWGEVGGIDFDPSGEELFIVNADKCVGGMMEFSRSKGTAYYENYGYENEQQHRRMEKDVRRRRRKRSSFIASSDEDSESTAFSDEDLAEDEEDEEELKDTRKRGKYYDSRRYKRLGHDMSSVFV